ncbi:ABC-2 transporter permease [Metabacillus rhizolycopersici]|uniref:ABC-2 transporter permease n=1 Tax=Metabacillus rhizolycopersici TaxID=2875709 RepID=A0ABS7UKX4_9BACI|nr:ABC-2 transporter permease [Metabacillus rhizolycopersici]MBZ5748973.1 ABC-2 transporter permease [Metabacillus rhizolycopersici]
MQALIKKDLLTQQKIVYLSCLIWFIPLTNFFTDGMPFKHVLLMTFLAFSLVFSSNFNTKTTEERQAIFINSLPVTRRQVVLAKYFTGLIWYGISAVFVTFYVLLFHLFAPFPSRMIYLEEYVISLSIMYILLSIFYPLIYAIGYTSALFLTGAILVSVLMAFQIILNLAENPRFPSVNDFLATLSQNQWMIAGILALVAIIITTISYQASVKIYNKADL